MQTGIFLSDKCLPLRTSAESPGFRLFSALQPTRDTKIAGIIEKALNELENYLAFYTFALPSLNFSNIIISKTVK